AELRQIAHGNPSIQFLGNQELSGVVRQLGNAKTLIMSSLWYETFGRTIAEAFACGTPVIASRLGAMNELVTDGVNGFHFTPGDAADLAKQVERMQSQSSDVGQNMRSNARTTFESRFTKSRSYAELIQIYGSVLGRSLESEQTPLCSEPFDLPFNPESTHGSRPAQLPTL
ncbi:MAG: glycosyltransferase, partial [Planctomycetota bacterium]